MVKEGIDSMNQKGDRLSYQTKILFIHINSQKGTNKFYILTKIDKKNSVPILLRKPY